MTGLRLFFFAEFAAVALLAPAAGLLARRLTGKLALAAGPVAGAMLPLLALVHAFLPGVPLGTVVTVQLMAAAFALAVAGVAALAGRICLQGGPVVVTLLALAVLATPFWGDLVLNLDSDGVRTIARTWLVRVNPLFTVAQQLQDFDWTHGAVLYGASGAVKITRIGEDFSYQPTAPWLICVCCLGAGLLGAAVAGLLRQRGRPAEHLMVHSRFC